MKTIFPVLASLAVVAALPAAARDVVVEVDARSGPWLNKANKKMRYGKGDELAPALVGGLAEAAGSKLEIFAAQGGVTQVDGTAVGPEGMTSQAVDDRSGPGGKFYPSLYAPKVFYPANRHALIAAFVDAEGRMTGRPFTVGSGVRVMVPDEAAALALGFNDVSFAANSGSLTVTVVIPDD